MVTLDQKKVTGESMQNPPTWLTWGMCVPLWGFLPSAEMLLVVNQKGQWVES